MNSNTSACNNESIKTGPTANVRVQLYLNFLNYPELAYSGSIRFPDSRSCKAGVYALRRLGL